MSVKKFKLNGTTEKRADVICKIFFKQTLPDTELRVLAVILDYSQNNEITITLEVAKQAKLAADVTDTNFSTALFRMEKKGLFSKVGKTITFHPVFNKIHETERIVISFD
jgi:DNA-binding MarR family transcriptional regulator